MTSKETLLEQIHHRETRPVPFTLGFDEAMEERLNEHFGNGDWNEGLDQYMLKVRALDFLKRDLLEGGTVGRDRYGSEWRLDRRPWHLEKPAHPSQDSGRTLCPGAGLLFWSLIRHRWL